MHQKNLLRKKFFSLRKKKYYEENKEFFDPLLKFIKKKLKNKKINFALYYPSNYEVNVIKFLENKYMLNQNLLLPVIEKKNFMNFFPWKNKDILLVNKFGFLEPFKTKAHIPDIILVPILAYDKNKYRLGYGKGFYDHYLGKFLKKFKNILTVGVAFSFQSHHKLPINQNDVRLDFIITEKGIY